MSSSGGRGKNFRRRTDETGDDNDDNNTNGNTNSTTTKPPPPSKPKKKPPSLLSFADEEGEEDAIRPSISRSRDREKTSSSRPTKPSSSHKITTSKDRRNFASLPSNVQPQAGTYTKEALLELQKNTRTLAAPSRPQQVSSEPRIVLKGLLKPQTGGDDTTDKKDKDDAESRLASMEIGKEGDSSVIMDKAAIDAIKAKRERLRKSRIGPMPDYISLEDGNNHRSDLKEELSDEELGFTGKLFGEGGKRGVFEVVEDKSIDSVSRKDTVEAVDDEHDEEDKLWEEEQCKKGLGKRVDDASITSSVGTSGIQNMQPQQQQRRPVSPTIGGVIGNAMSISQQADIAKRAIYDNVRRLKESHSKTKSLLEKTDENLSASLLNVTDLEKARAAADEKYIFMQKLRDFISVLCEFLQHKAPLIEELEEQMQNLNSERALAIFERRAADNDDELVEVEAAVKAATLVLSERGNSVATVKAATTAAQAASAAIREVNLPEKLDEFGRDMNRQKRLDMERRAEARQLRKARFESKRVSSMDVDGSHQKIEGESSTDESDSESNAYKSNRKLLLQTADEAFSDAAEEYSQLSLVKEKFERWKRDYALSYRDAYMSLSVPSIFSPYVRLELLKWDPLHENSDFSDMKWHSLLFSYGSLEDGSDYSADDADADLVPGLVEKVALPILQHEISQCWDVLSTRETKNAVSAISLVIDYIPASSEALAELLVAVRTRLADAVAKIMVPRWSPLVMKAVPNASRVAAYRFGMSVRLLRNICLWKEILASPVLEKMALDELLYGKILPHVQMITSDVHDAITRTERTVASLSGVWTSTSAKKDNSRKLKPLVDYVLQLGRTLEKRHASGVTESEFGALARRLKKMLVDLNEYDKARDVARAFNLKEAL